MIAAHDHPLGGSRAGDNVPVPTDTEARLGEVARLLAVGILRRRHRMLHRTMKVREVAENRLDVFRKLRTHGIETSRRGDRP